MAVAGTSGVCVRVEDVGSAVLVDVTMPPHLSASSLSLDLQQGVVRLMVPKPSRRHAFDELTELDEPGELLGPRRIINPNASGV